MWWCPTASLCSLSLPPPGRRRVGNCREEGAAEGALPPYHSPGVQILQLFQTPGFGLETALVGLQQVLFHGLGGPWEGSASKHVQLLGPDGLTCVSLCQAKMTRFPLFWEQGHGRSLLGARCGLSRGSVLGAEGVR